MSLLLLALALQRDLPKEVREAFEKAESLELYSLDPSKGERKSGGFHHWPILGKTELRGAKLQAAFKAVEKGARDSDGGVALCFIPRHGIRLARLDLVLCFECLQVRVYEGDRKVDDFLTTSGPASALNKILSDAGVPLPMPPK